MNLEPENICPGTYYKDAEFSYKSVIGHAVKRQSGLIQLKVIISDFIQSQSSLHGKMGVVHSE